MWTYSITVSHLHHTLHFIMASLPFSIPSYVTNLQFLISSGLHLWNKSLTWMFRPFLGTRVSMEVIVTSDRKLGYFTYVSGTYPTYLYSGYNPLILSIMDIPVEFPYYSLPFFWARWDSGTSSEGHPGAVRCLHPLRNLFETRRRCSDLRSLACDRDSLCQWTLKKKVWTLFSLLNM